MDGQVDRWAFHAAGGQTNRFDPETAVFTFFESGGLILSALFGQGIAQVGVHAAWPHLRAGRLKVVLGDCHHPGSHEMTLQYPHRALLAPRVRVTVNYLLEVFALDEALHVPLDALGAYAA